jgi:hypothetical protein
MTRLLSPYSRGLAALLLFAAVPAFPQPGSSRLDEAMPIPAAWSPTEAFDEVVLSGADDVVVSQGDRWRIRGELAIERVHVGRLVAKIAGSGDMRLAGRAASMQVQIAGSGDLSGEAMQVTDAELAIAGSGDTRLQASGRVSASIVGSGNAAVTGTRDCTQNRMGSGRLTCTR